MASIDLGKGVSHVGFSASSEDDSVFVIAADLGPAGEPTGTIYMMIDTEGHATRLAGYDYMAQLVPAALADSLPGNDFGPRPVPSAAP